MTSYTPANLPPDGEDWTPVPKIMAAAGWGAVAFIIVWVLKVAGIEVEDGLTEALTEAIPLLVALFAGYWKADTR